MSTVLFAIRKTIIGKLKNSGGVRYIGAQEWQFPRVDGGGGVGVRT